MAFSAHKDEAQMKEHFEEEETVDKKAKQIADLIRQSKHFIIFTGAGVSTSAGIPDFRGPDGVWTLSAQGRQRTGPTTSTLQAIPTPTHMSILKLLRSGNSKYLVSQNTDGLHRKSGVPPNQIGELHGNSNLEICEKCGKQYLRDFHCRGGGGGIRDHFTGRYCNCGGKLNDSIINFSEPLPQSVIRKAFEEAQKADLCLVLGSSLTVTPAANIPETVGKNGKLVICNLQATPLDNLAAVRVFARTDDLMQAIMRHLGLAIPEWRLHRRLQVGTEYNPEQEKTTLYLRGIDVDGTPVSFIKNAQVTLFGKTYNMPQEPFQLSFKAPTVENDQVNAHFKIEFMGHYMEPPLEFDHTVHLRQPSKAEYHLEYNPFRREWKIYDEKEDRANLSVSELKKGLAARGIDYSCAVEKKELLDLFDKASASE